MHLIAVLTTDTSKTWLFDESLDFTEQNVKQFLDSLLAGTEKPHYRSPKAPEDNTGPVLVVVGNTFDELVMNNDKDVLVEFYAPC